MILPPGAFMLIGYLVAANKTWNENREKKAAAREREAAKAARLAAQEKGAEA